MSEIDKLHPYFKDTPEEESGAPAVSQEEIKADSISPREQSKDLNPPAIPR
jgi:hypothetical protein